MQLRFIFDLQLHNHPTMKQNFLILFLIAIAAGVAAQPGGNPYDSYTPGSYNNYLREKNNAARNAKELERHHYEPAKSTNKTYSAPSGKNPLEDLLNKWSDEKANAKEDAKKQERAAAVARDERTNANAKHQQELNETRNSINKYVASFKGNLEPEDVSAMANDGLFTRTTRVAKEFELPEKDFYGDFNREINKADPDFPKLVSLPKALLRYPATTTKCYQQLMAKFPDQAKAVEDDYLYSLQYYFGAYRPMMYPGGGFVYPISSYEAMNEADQTKLLQTFLSLAQKYPDLALRVAGGTRDLLNPFELIAEKLDRDPQQKTLHYFQVLFSDHTASNLPGFGKTETDNWEQFAQRRLGKAAYYLRFNATEMVKALTADNWIEIGRRNRITLKLVRSVFGFTNLPTLEEAMRR